MERKTRRVPAGTCAICGCSEDAPCSSDDGWTCSWLDKDRVICGNCVHTIAGAVGTAIMGLMVERLDARPIKEKKR